MTQLPRHPESRDDPRPLDGPPTRRPWTAFVVAGTVAALLVLMIVLHLTGAVGPGAH